MYNWVDGTWNPLAGECPHKCVYCSTHKLMRYDAVKNKYSGEPRIDLKTILKNLGKNKTWFVVGQNDLFAESIPSVFIYEVLNQCSKYDNTYLFQTKNPDRYIQYLDLFPKKSILCTTLETNRHNEASKAPSPFDRAFAMSQINDFTKYITIEPIMDFDLANFVQLIKHCNPAQVNIGANSYPKIKLNEPSKNKILEFITELERFTIVNQKSNLKRLLK